jgi:hypothetical protein
MHGVAPYYRGHQRHITYPARHRSMGFPRRRGLIRAS